MAHMDTRPTLNLMDEMENTLMLMDECVPVLNATEETRHLGLVREYLQKWVDLLVNVREQRIKQQIKDLHKELQREESEVEREMQRSDEQLEKIKMEIDKMKKTQGETEQQSSKLSEELAQLKKKHQEMLQAQEELSKTSDKDQKYKHMVDLCMYISNIRWQADCPPEQIKGYVCNKDNVQPFLLNANENSSYYISNYLWSLMEPEW